jgi:hypothetical protein
LSVLTPAHLMRALEEVQIFLASSKCMLTPSRA